MNELAQKVDRYRQYVEADPRNATLWIAYGDVLHRAGLIDRAESAYRSGLEIDPRNVIANGRLATLEISRQNFSGAEEMLRKLIDSGEQEPALRFNLALAQYYQRRFEEALAQFEALTLDAQIGSEAAYYVISCLHNLLREEEAIVRGELLLARFPGPRLRGYLALVHLDAQRATEAYELARQALREQPDNTDAAAVLATHALEEQRIDEADRLLRLVSTREPTNVRALQGLGLGALHRGEHEIAISHLTRAIEADPQNLASYITLGWVHVTRHDYANGERVFRDGIVVDGNEAELHGGLATALVFQRMFDEAKREISVALRLAPACFGALFARSILLQLAGKQELATKLVAQILQRSMRPGAPTPLDSLLDYWKRHPAPSGQRKGAHREH
jgi:cytochrome c-type biogenesis protein CcmH/NrfG